MGEPYVLYQSLISTSVLIGMTEHYSYCSHIVSIHIVMDIVSLSTSLLLIPVRFSSFCLSVLSVPQGLNYPLFSKVTRTWYFLLPLVSPSDPLPLWTVHSLFPWQAQVFPSSCSPHVVVVEHNTEENAWPHVQSPSLLYLLKRRIT